MSRDATSTAPIPFTAPRSSAPAVPRLPWRPRTGAIAHGLIGRSAPMLQLLAAIERFAPHARTTLISGETGTGKAAVARTLYRLGPRRGGAFVEVDCAAADDGATWPTALADADATCFFADVADLSAVQQIRLAQRLAVTDAPWGSRATGHVIAATAADLRAAIAAGRFRSDLYYRLGVFALHLPPLRDRPSDLPELAAAFVGDLGQRLGLDVRGVTPAAVRVLQQRDWPGNLRELRNVLERACVLTDGDTVGEGAVRAALVHATAPDGAADDADRSSPRLDDAQRAHLRAVLRDVHGNKTRAAERLGISRRALYRLLDRPHL